MDEPFRFEVMTEEAKDKAPARTARLTDADFAIAANDYELGHSGLSELADRYDISRQALSKRFKDAIPPIVRGSRSHEVVATVTATVAAAAAAPAPLPVERFADRRPEWIEEARMQGYNALKQAQLIARKIVLDQVKKKDPITGESMPLGMVDDDLKAAQRFNKIIVENVAATLLLLNAAEHIDDADLPILTIEDLTDEEVLQHHKNTGAMDEDATIEDMLAESQEFGDLDG